MTGKYEIKCNDNCNVWSQQAAAGVEDHVENVGCFFHETGSQRQSGTIICFITLISNSFNKYIFL